MKMQQTFSPESRPLRGSRFGDRYRLALCRVTLWPESSSRLRLEDTGDRERDL